MTRTVVLTVVFCIGIIYSGYQAIMDLKSAKGEMTYKGKYYSLWTVLFAYLVYMQYAD